MKVSKVTILFYFVKLRLSRLFCSNQVSQNRKKKWQNTLMLSPFYKKLVDNNQELPIMNKALFMRNFDLINTVGIHKEEAMKLAFESEQTRDFSPTINNISIGLSSGTSGNRGMFLTSSKEKAIWVAAILDRVIGFSIQKRKVAFFLRANNNLYEAVNSTLLSFHFFDLKIPLEKHFEALKELKADILVGQPSVLMGIARIYQTRQIKPTYSIVISVAEVLEEDYRQVLYFIFNCPIKQVYQCTEGFLGYTCKKGKLHINEDWLRLEKKYIDDENTRFHPIITDYLRTSQPVVRYELNDILHEDKNGCDCGAKSTVICKIEGRSDDIFRFSEKGKEVIIYPDFIRRSILRASDEIVDYTVTLTAARTISISLIVENPLKWQEVFENVQYEIQQLLNEFEIEGVDIIMTDHKHDLTTKFRRIKNEYSTCISH